MDLFFLFSFLLPALLVGFAYAWPLGVDGGDRTGAAHAPRRPSLCESC